MGAGQARQQQQVQAMARSKKVQPLTVRWSNRRNGRHGEDENIKRV